jgi:membrane protease subunit HflC
MNQQKLFVFFGAFLVTALIVFSSVFVVDQRQFAIIFAFGEIKTVVKEPGLHFKLPAPLQSVVYLDSRILTIDTPDSDRVQTSEKKNLLVDSFIKWRISDPKLFFVSFAGGSDRLAQDRILGVVRDAVNLSINKRTINAVTSSERELIMEEVRKVAGDLVKSYGVEVVDVRLKRIDFVPEISDSVYKRMEAERKRVANEQRSIGAALAENLRADADRQKEVLLAEAYRKAQQIRGEGDASASKIYAKAFGKNPEFYSFYKSLEAYRESFKTKSDVIVVDPNSDFFRYMKKPSR